MGGSLFFGEEERFLVRSSLSASDRSLSWSESTSDELHMSLVSGDNSSGNLWTFRLVLSVQKSILFSRYHFWRRILDVVSCLFAMLLSA